MFKVLSVNQTLHLRAFQDRWTFLNQHNDSFDWLGFLDKSNLLKIPDCRSFSVLKTLTGYRPYSYSIKGKPCSRSCLLCSKFSLTELVLKRRSASDLSLFAINPHDIPVHRYCARFYKICNSPTFFPLSLKQCREFSPTQGQRIQSIPLYSLAYSPGWPGCLSQGQADDMCIINAYPKI